MDTARSTGTSPSTRSFYGWRIVAFASLTMAMTAPGQTVGVSVFIDPMMETLGMSRSQVSGAYLIGTLAGGAAMPFVGRFIDAFGVRRVMTVVGLIFGIALASMSAVGGLVALMAGFAGIRMLGQGSLSLVSTTAVALWFERRRGLAMAVTSSAGVGAMSFVPLGLAALILTVGWRTSWMLAGLAVWAVVLPVARFGMKDRPEHVGQFPDGDPEPTVEETARRGRDAWTRSEAMRTLMFWALTGTVAATGLVATAMMFHHISLLTEQGLSPTQAAATFVAMTASSIVATLIVGTLADRGSPKLLAMASMALLGGALVLAQTAAPGWRVVAYVVALGSSGGAARAVEAASFPRYFGIRHIGSIRGTVMAVMVGGSALGPYLLAVGHERFGGYGPALTTMLVIPTAVILLLVGARAPDGDLRERVRGGRSA